MLDKDDEPIELEESDINKCVSLPHIVGKNKVQINFLLDY